MYLQDKINKLERQIAVLESTIQDLLAKQEDKKIQPFSKVGQSESISLVNPVDATTGLGALYGNGVIWNDSELKIPSLHEEPPIPTKGYNKHGHSEFSGGALDINTVEFIEFDLSGISNKHSQMFWQTQPEIKTELNSSGEAVAKKGNLDIAFNADTGKWGFFEINVEKVNFVKRKSDGTIETDSKGQEMKSPLYNSDSTKTSLVWDVNAKVWRIYAVYAE
jgi:hypothetical protein